MGNSTKILNHVSIPVGYKEDIANFFSHVLGFDEKYRFVVDQSTAFSIFGINDELEVTVIEKEGLKLELFHFEEPCKPGISHICLAVSGLNRICRVAEESGYQTVKINRSSGTVAFVSDKSGNRFEIKEIGGGHPDAYKE
jgi:catechol 2,3-dioxygenase-like lactoylglutathione lyase family enzyme